MPTRGSCHTSLRFLPGLFAVLSLLLGPSPAKAEDHNFDMGAGGDFGAPTAWDSESVNPLSGNLNLSIPLYSIELGPDFSMSLALIYNSISWNPANRYLLDGYADFQDVKGKNPAGVGWRLNIPRITLHRYYAGGEIAESFYSFESADGGSHRLHRDNCTSSTIWVTNDTSGIRAESVGDSVHYSRWVVWEPNGTKYIMEHFTHEDRVGVSQTESTQHWDTIRMESARRLNDAEQTAAHWVDIEWWDPSIGHDGGYHWHYPQSMVDSYGRSITFEGESGPEPNEMYQDGGRLTAIVVPGTDKNGFPRRIRYTLNQEYRTIVDPATLATCPVNYPDCPLQITREGVLVLTGITATVPEVDENDDPIGPVLTYDMQYNQSGMLSRLTLPGGGARVYDYGWSRIWKRDFPMIYADPAIVAQFEYLPVYSIIRRSLTSGTSSWSWNYDRLNERCTWQYPLQCYNHANKVIVRGPATGMATGVARSFTVYRYRATAKDGVVSDGTTVTPGEVSPLDGTLESVEMYAGSDTSGRLLRRTEYEYVYQQPPASGCLPDVNPKDHYADAVRVSRSIATVEDDRKTPHDTKVVENTNWQQLSGDTWVARQVNEYLADGTTFYRSKTAAYELITNPHGGVRSVSTILRHRPVAFSEQPR